MAQMRPPVLVIACGSRKIPTPAPARDLYVGSLFRAARAAAEADGRPWLICSAAHGLLTPDTVIAPYERALGSSRADIARLAGLIAAQRPPPVVEAWTPRRYTAALAHAGVRIGAAPLAGLGIGHQLTWLTQHRTHPHHRTRERHPMTTGEPHLLHVAPGELITTTNVRADLNLDDEFLASIRAQGVLVPIVATRTDSGQLAIEYGHRRAAAAAEVGLGTVPVVVMPAADTHAARVMAQMTENDRRAALSTEEKLAAHEQLAILGVTVADVARTTGTDQATVKAARKVATDPTARAAAAAGLDLADALVLGEFADDPEFVTELAEVALDEGRDHMLRAAERRRQEIALEQALAGEEQNWRDQGYQIVDPASSDHSVAPMWRILNDAGDSITDQDHADCPGRAVKVSGWRIDMIKATHYCIDPDEHHPNQVQVRNTWSSTPTPEPDQAAKSAERARVITHNKDWRASEPIRRQHVRDWLAGAKPTPAITRWLLGELIDPGPIKEPHQIRTALAELKWAADVLRPATVETAHRYAPARDTLQPLPTASQPRALMASLAWLLADREANTSTESWRSVNASTTRYLEFLEEHTGYQLGPVEQLAAGRSISEAAHRPEVADAGEDDDDPDAYVEDPLGIDPPGGDPITAEDDLHTSAGGDAVAAGR